MKKECRKARWRKANPEKARTATKEWQKRNPNKGKEYYQENREKELLRVKKWFENNPKAKKQRSEYAKQWHLNNREKVNKHFKERWANDPKFRLSKLISSKIRQSLKNGKDWESWEVLVGYTKDDLIKHLKRTVQSPYCWNDYINGRIEFHIDHKIPIAVFNFDSYENPDFKRCWALKNLQLIPAQDNLKKGATIDKHFQPSLLLTF